MSTTYELGGARLSVRTTSARFGESLDGALARYRGAGEEPPTYSIVLDGGANVRRRSSRGFHILYWGTTPLIRTLSFKTLIGGLMAELEATTFGRRDDSIYVRAALIRAGGKTALVPWWVACHISELGGRVDRAGLKLPATTWVAVDEESGCIVPTRRRLEIEEHPLRKLAGDGRADDRHFVEEPTRVDVICTYLDGNTPLQPISRGVALHRLAGAVGNLDEVRGRSVEGLGRLVSGARCFGIGMYSAPDMLEALLVTLGRATGGPHRPGEPSS